MCSSDMPTGEAAIKISEAAGLLERALRLLDETDHYIAAARLDHVLHLLHSSPGSVRGR